MPPSFLGALLNAAPSTKTPVPLVSRTSGAFSGWRYNRGATQALGAMEAASVVFGIVDRLATSVSLVDWKLWQKAKSGKPEDRTEVTSHLALDILNSPNEFYSRAEMMEAAQQHQELTGESWLAVSRNPRARSIPLELWPVRPDRMEPVPSAESYIAGYEYRSPDGECVPLRKDDVLFVRRPDPNNPYRGLGPIRSTLTDIDSIRFSMEWNKNFFVNGAEPGGIVEIDRRLSDDEFDELVARWREQHQGTSNAHRVAILEQVKWVDRKYTMRDMQFTELRGVTEAGVKLAFGFPKFMLGQVDDVNRATADASEYTYSKWLVVPRLERWKGVFNRRFLPMFGSTGVGLEFDYVSPVGEDTEAENASRTSRVGAVASLVPLGYDPKETLKVFGLPDIPFEKPEPPAPVLAPNGKAPGKKPDPLQALLGPALLAHKPGGVDHDQSKHGRRGGKRRLSKVSDAAGRLAAGVASGVKSSTPLSGGLNALVERVEFNDGSKAIRKRAVDDVQTRFDRLEDPENEFGGTLSAKAQQDAEELAASVAQAIGVRVPAMHRAAEDDAFFELVDGETAIMRRAGDSAFRARPFGDTDDGVKLGFFDALINNADRHEGNWMIDRDGNLVGIDHGQTFQDSFGSQDSYGTGDPFSENFSDNAGMWWDDNDMSPADVALARERLTGLRPEFDRLGRGDWHEAMMGRLEGIAERAQGSTRRLS